METYEILATIGIVMIFGSPLISIIIRGILNYIFKDVTDWFAVSAISCLFCGCSLMLASLFIRPNYPLVIFDVEIKAYCVDGRSMIIRKDSITESELPYIKEGYKTSRKGVIAYSRKPTGTYSLYFGEDCYYGVIRFEYLKNRKYTVDYKLYMNNRCKNK